MKQETQAVLNMNEKHLRGYMAGYLSKEAKISLPDISPELKQRLINTGIATAAGGGAGALYDLASKGKLTATSPLIGAGLGAGGYTAYDVLKNYKPKQPATTKTKPTKAKPTVAKRKERLHPEEPSAMDEIANYLVPLYMDEEGAFDPNGLTHKNLKILDDILR